MAGYHYLMPSALPCAVRHIIGVASQFIGWIFPNINTYPRAFTRPGRPAEWSGMEYRGTGLGRRRPKLKKGKMLLIQ